MIHYETSSSESRHLIQVEKPYLHAFSGKGAFLNTARTYLDSILLGNFVSYLHNYLVQNGMQDLKTLIVTCVFNFRSDSPCHLDTFLCISYFILCFILHMYYLCKLRAPASYLGRINSVIIRIMDVIGRPRKITPWDLGGPLHVH